MPAFPLSRVLSAFVVTAKLTTHKSHHRIDDGSQDWAQFRFAPNNTVGAYQATPGQAAALYPQLANTTTFVTPLASDWYPTQFSQLQPAQVSKRFSRLQQMHYLSVAHQAWHHLLYKM